MEKKKKSICVSFLFSNLDQSLGHMSCLHTVSKPDSSEEQRLNRQDRTGSGQSGVSSAAGRTRPNSTENIFNDIANKKTAPLYDRDGIMEDLPPDEQELRWCGEVGNNEMLNLDVEFPQCLIQDIAVDRTRQIEIKKAKRAQSVSSEKEARLPGLGKKAHSRRGTWLRIMEELPWRLKTTSF
eukprot:scaffold5977_cov98-Cylindrotheca_fusiformis.AAC.5